MSDFVTHGLYYIVHGILQARILEWVAFPFSRGSSQLRNQTQISYIAGGFFTSSATREPQEYWIGYSPGNLPDPGIKLGSPALQADSLPTELSHAELLQSCPTLCGPMNCSPPGSSVHGILQARYQSQLPFSTPGEIPDPGTEPVVLTSPSLVGMFFTTNATWESHHTHIKIYTVTQNYPSKMIS